MQSWLEFWNRKHRIYVNERHLQAHYHRIADDLLALLNPGEADLLDWGCGSALGAPLLAEHGLRVSLYDKAPVVQAGLRERHGGDGRLRILTDAAFAGLPAASFDVVLVNSVAQYLPPVELPGLVTELARLLRPGGRLIVADVISPETGMLDDIRALLMSGLRYGYFTAAVGSLGVTFFSDYRRLRGSLGLATYQPEEMVEILAAAKLEPRRLPRNIGFSGHRMAFEGWRREPPPSSDGPPA